MEKKTKKVANKKVKKNESSGSVEYVTREAFDAHMIDMSKVMDNQFIDINQKTENRTQYQGWLVSPQLHKRVLAIVGHVMLFNLAIYIPIMFSILILG